MTTTTSSTRVANATKVPPPRDSTQTQTQTQGVPDSFFDAKKEVDTSGAAAMALLASFHEEVEGTENRVRSTLAEEEAMAAEIEAGREEAERLERLVRIGRLRDEMEDRRRGEGMVKREAREMGEAGGGERGP